MNCRCQHCESPIFPPDEGNENKPTTEERRPDLQPGEPCRKCDTPVVKQMSRRPPKNDFYYEFYLWCPKCNATFTVEAARRRIEEPPTLL